MGTAATSTGCFRGFAGVRACRFRRWFTTCCRSSPPTWALAVARPARVVRGSVRRRASGTSVRSARRRWPSADRCRRRRGRYLCWDQWLLRRFGRSVRPSQLTSSSSPWRRRDPSRRAASSAIRLRPHCLAAPSVLRGLAAFYRSGAFCAFPASCHVALGLWGGWGLQRHRGPGRRSTSASIAATPRRRAVGSSVRVGGRRRCARAPWWFFLSPCGLRCTSSRHSAGRQCAYGRRCALQRG